MLYIIFHIICYSFPDSGSIMSMCFPPPLSCIFHDGGCFSMAVIWRLIRFWVKRNNFLSSLNCTDAICVIRHGASLTPEYSSLLLI